MSDVTPPARATLPPARKLAMTALVIAVSAPFWLQPLMNAAGLGSPEMSRLAATHSALQADDRRLADVEQRLEQAATELARNRAEALQLRARTDTLAGWSSLYALNDLATALRQNGPFILQLATARAIGSLPNDTRQLLDQLVPYAAVGVPDIGRITRDFASRAGRVSGGQDSLPVAMVNRLFAWSGLSGDPQSTEGSRRVAEANTRLAAGDLAAAVDSISQVDGHARELFADWLDDARARLAADRLATQVDTLLARGTARGARP